MKDKFKVGDKVKLNCPIYMSGLTGTISGTRHGYLGIEKYYDLSLDEEYISPSGFRLIEISRSERELEII